DNFEPYWNMLRERRVKLVVSAHAVSGEPALLWDGHGKAIDVVLSNHLGPWLRKIRNPGAVTELAAFLADARILLGLDPQAPVVVHVVYNEKTRLAILGKLDKALEDRHRRSMDDAAQVTFRLFANSRQPFDIELSSVIFRP